MAEHQKSGPGWENHRFDWYELSFLFSFVLSAWPDVDGRSNCFFLIWEWKAGHRDKSSTWSSLGLIVLMDCKWAGGRLSESMCRSLKFDMINITTNGWPSSYHCLVNRVNRIDQSLYSSKRHWTGLRALANGVHVPQLCKAIQRSWACEYEYE